MRHHFLLCLFLAFAVAIPASAQVEPVPAKAKTRVERVKVTPQKREPNAAVLWDSILPLEESNRYKALIREKESKLKRMYEANPSGELPFYADTTGYCYKCWFSQSTRFKNTRKEMDNYLQLLESTHALYQRKALTILDRRELIKAMQDIERLREKIKPVDMNGNPQMGCYMTVVTPTQAQVTISVKSGSIGNISNVRICLATPTALSSCRCVDCTNNKDSKPPNTCNTTDINCLKTSGTGKFVLFSGMAGYVDNGYYHLIVSEKSGTTEKALYYTTINISGNTTKTYSF